MLKYAKRIGRNILDITLDVSLKLDKMISFNDARNLIKISRDIKYSNTKTWLKNNLEGEKIVKMKNYMPFDFDSYPSVSRTCAV